MKDADFQHLLEHVKDLADRSEAAAALDSIPRELFVDVVNLSALIISSLQDHIFNLELENLHQHLTPSGVC